MFVCKLLTFTRHFFAFGFISVFFLQNIRAATSRSGRKGSFQEDLQQARGEFVAAHVRYAKLVTLTADEKFNEPAEEDKMDSANSKAGDTR